MTKFTFEHWTNGALIGIESVEAETIQEAVCILSTQYKNGVFRLKSGKVICAWCKKEMSDLPGLSGDTHGICDDCKEREWNRYLSSREVKE